MFNPTPAMAGWFGYPLELNDRLRLIRDAGFRGVLLWWAVESTYEPPVPMKVETAAKYGLSVVNAHLQFAHMNSLWLDGCEGEHYAAELAGLIAEAGVYGVPTLVVHLTRTQTPPPFSDPGFSRFLRLCEHGFVDGPAVFFSADDDASLPAAIRTLADASFSAGSSLCHGLTSCHTNYHNAIHISSPKAARHRKLSI